MHIMFQTVPNNQLCNFTVFKNFGKTFRVTEIKNLLWNELLINIFFENVTWEWFFEIHEEIEHFWRLINEITQIVTFVDYLFYRWRYVLIFPSDEKIQNKFWWKWAVKSEAFSSLSKTCCICDSFRILESFHSGAISRLISLQKELCDPSFIECWICDIYVTFCSGGVHLNPPRMMKKSQVSLHKMFTLWALILTWVDRSRIRNESSRR